MIIWPQGLPGWDPVDILLDAYSKQIADPTILGLLDRDTALAWWAGKCLGRREKLSFYLGRNEKTRIVVKLTKPGSGAPTREPAINEAQQREMMAFYYKKQEEFKRMQEESERNPQEALYERGGSKLKEAFQGIPSSIRFK